MSLIRTKNNIITYTVNKAYNSDVYISIQNGEVVINAPWYTTNSQIQKLVQERKQWILNKLAEYEEKRKEKMTKIKLLGQVYQIIVQYRNVKTPSLTIQEQNIQVELPSKYKKIGEQEVIEMLVNKMYQMVAEKEIENAMEKIRFM